MILFLFISASYVGILLFFRPTPASLKADPLPLSKNFDAVKASLFSGLFFLIIFLFTSGFEFRVIDEHLYWLLALNNIEEMSTFRPMQAITHLFIHINLYHVVANVSVLGLTSVYERRVGSKRFITVLTVASVASIPSILFYSEDIAVSGISGGVFGLAAAYFTDHEDLTAKEWFYAISLATFLVVVFTLEGELKSRANSNLQFQVDHIGHAMSAITAIIYCRLTSKHLTRKLSGRKKHVDY